MLFQINGIRFEMREPHDLSFLLPYGQVFKVMDQLVSGNLCFGVEGSYGRLFVKYAGAPAVNATIPPVEAVITLRRAAERYPVHPALPRLLTHGPVGNGYAAFYEWVDGEPLRDENTLQVSDAVYTLPVLEKLRMLEKVFSLHLQLAETGWMAVDLSPRNLLINMDQPAIHVCDIDLYRQYPCQNLTGWLPGEADFLSPEELEKGATIDQRATVWKLGRLAALLMGDPSLQGHTVYTPRPLLPVILKASAADPDKRYETVGSFVAAWRAAIAELF